MRSSKNRNLTLYGVHRNPTVRFGAVSTCHKSCGAARCYDGAVRCGCEKQDILRCGSVRFSEIKTSYGADFRNQDYFGAVLCVFQISQILRCGSVPFSQSRNLTVRFGAAPR